MDIKKEAVMLQRLQTWTAALSEKQCEMFRNSQSVCPTNERAFSGKISVLRILEFGPEG